MNCGAVRPYLQAFVDTELSPERCIAIELHLAECRECMAEVELTRSLCRATRNAIAQCPVCPDVHARLVNCVREERMRQDNHSFDPLSWRVIAPIAAAAATTLFLSAKVPAAHGIGEGSSYREASMDDSSGTSGREKEALSSSQLSSNHEVIEAGSQDGLMDFLIRHHAARYEPEVVEPGSVNHLEPYLGFRVQTPDFGRYGARFEGANLVPVNRTRAAVLHYSLAGKRVTLYMYNPDELPMRAQRALTPRVVGNRAVFVGHRRGYSIATCESEGVGYAVTTDLSGEESAELVAALDL